MNTTITPQKFIELDEMKQQLHILQDKFQKEIENIILNIKK